ncbi:MAG: hypothetical protein KC448_06520 [Yoonia sp.]|nr:hypothetical protein [Yoonia sp.]
MRALILFVIGIVFGTGLGVIISAPMEGHDHAGHSDTGHDHSVLTEWTGPAPSLALTITDDTGDGKNLFIDVAGFTFTPETVNTVPVAGTGHTHIYVDGIKILRAYGPWVHLTGAPSGSVVRVTLNANDHTGWAIDGQPIVAEITVP